MIDTSKWREFLEWRDCQNKKLREKVEHRLEKSKPKTRYRKFLWWKWETMESKVDACIWADAVVERLSRIDLNKVPRTIEAYLDWLVSTNQLQQKVVAV